MDFRIGYSPERSNPGDEKHTTESITKIVAGMDAESADRLAGLYGLITSVYRAKDIKIAEDAKVIEGFGVKALGDPDGTVDCVIVTVAHDEFKEMGLPDVERLMAMDEPPVLIDVRGMFDEKDARCRGFVYQTL